MTGLQAGHDVYGKDKPIGPLITEIDNLIEGALGDLDIIWADVIRAV